MRYAKVVDLTEADLDAVLAVNFKGVLFGSQVAARRMVEQRSGSIVNVASAILDGPQPRMVAYAVSKAAVSVMTRTLAMEVGKHGVRANVVAPGWTRTGMTDEQFTGPDGQIDESAADAMTGDAGAVHADAAGRLNRATPPTRSSTWHPTAPGSSPVRRCGPTAGSRCRGDAPRRSSRDGDAVSAGVGLDGSRSIICPISGRTRNGICSVSAICVDVRLMPDTSRIALEHLLQVLVRAGDDTAVEVARARGRVRLDAPRGCSRGGSRRRVKRPCAMSRWTKASTS